MRGLKDLRVIVVGGANGIGAALVRRLASEGAKVVIGDIKTTDAEALAQELSSTAAHKVISAHFDLGDEASAKRLADVCVAAHGGIDGLVNMAGGVPPPYTGASDVDVLNMDPEFWRRALDMNLVGYGRTTKAVLPHMLAQNRGAIVNISSNGVWNGLEWLPAYMGAKGGVHVLTRHTAKAYGRSGVRANAVAFALIGTEMALKSVDEKVKTDCAERAALGRIGTAFLLSEDAAYVSGQVWSCCGGSVLRD